MQRPLTGSPSGVRDPSESSPLRTRTVTVRDSTSHSIDRNMLQREIENTLRRFERIKTQKAIIEEQLFMCERERHLLGLDMKEALDRMDLDGVRNWRILQHTQRMAEIKSHSVNETKFEIKTIKNRVNYSRTAYIHLKGGLNRLHKKSKRDDAELSQMEKDIMITDSKNEKDLEELVQCKRNIDEINSRYGDLADDIITDGLKNSMKEDKTQRRKLNRIIDEKHYINTYPLIKDSIRKYMLNNREKNNISRLYKHQLLQINQKFEKLRSHASSPSYSDFASNFIETEIHMQSLMNRLMYLLSANQDTEELVSKGTIENQITRDMAKDFKNTEMESVLPDEESVVETCIMLLEHRLEKERDYSEEINQRFERFFAAFEDGSALRSFTLEAKSKYIVRELKDNVNSFDDFYHKTLKINEIINKVPQDENKFTKYIQDKKDPMKKRMSESLDTQSNDDATSIGSVKDDKEGRLNYTQFAENQENKQVWTHEESFRRKTRNLINNMIEKEQRIKDTKGDLLQNVGGHMAKVAQTLIGIEQKLANTNLFLNLGVKLAGATNATTATNLAGISNSPATNLSPTKSVSKSPGKSLFKSISKEEIKSPY